MNQREMDLDLVANFGVSIFFWDFHILFLRAGSDTAVI